MTDENVASMINAVSENDFVKLPTAAAATAMASTQVPVFGSAVAVPCAQAMFREGVKWILTCPGQSAFQSTAVKLFAESAATNMVVEGGAPYVLGATAFSATLTGVAAYQVGKFAYDCSFPCVPEPGQNAKEYSIARADLETITEKYKTRSRLRSGLSFFMGKDSLEIAAIKKFLKANSNLQDIKLSELAKVIEGGKEHRINALNGHEKIPACFFHNSGTDSILNEIIERSLDTQCQNTLGVQIP